MLFHSVSLTHIITLHSLKTYSSGLPFKGSIDEDCLDALCLSYLRDDRAWYLCFGDDEEAWFLGKLEVVPDGLSDADVVFGDDGRDFSKDPRVLVMVFMVALIARRSTSRACAIFDLDSAMSP